MRRIAIFTGSRAEYGLLYPIVRAIAAHSNLEYFLLAGGTHLTPEFGLTLDEIAADGFCVYREVAAPAREQSQAYTALSIADTIAAVSGILAELQPDALVVYGDRFETFGAAIAASQMNIAVAHVEGGDYTEGGALDDSVRHAITKLAHLHFTTNAQAAGRVLALGEEAWRVHNAGLPALDLAREGRFAQPDELIGEFGFDVTRPIVLFCQHAIATEPERAAAQFRPSMDALLQLAGEGCQIVITYPNNDAGGRAIIAELERAPRRPGIHVVKSLGRRRFHGMLHLMGNVGRGVLAGNSSAGIKEARAFQCPAVNIGTRQDGRLRAANVIDAPHDAAAIANAIRRAVAHDAFRRSCRTCENPYGEGNAGIRIADTLARTASNAALLRKKLTWDGHSNRAADCAA
jgi:UDP-N-acetylglucosamine 2-epimerase (non-hydrolysing)/GDP/UDP-N,N'-diacetylbacillosamine 2-epimerase (hydrolysing)